MIVALYGFRRLWVKTSVAIRMANGEDHDAEFVVYARTAYRCSGQRRLRRNFDFLDKHLIRAGAVTGDIEKVEQVRSQKALRDTMARGGIRRDHGIGAGCLQVLLRTLLTGAGNDLDPRVQAARGKHDINVG